MYLYSLFEQDSFDIFHFELTLSYKDNPLFASVGVCHNYSETQSDNYWVVPREVSMEFETRYDNKIYFSIDIFRTQAVV